MRRRKFVMLCAVLVMMFCGTAWAKLADDMTISGNFAKGYTVNNWYSSYVTVSGGVTNYTFNIMEGELPPGFFIRQSDSQFYLEGIPNTAGTWTFKLRVTDRRDCYAERELSVTIDAESYKADDMSLSGSFTASGETGTFYQSDITVSGGVSDYTFNISGTLPAGLYIRQDGSRFYLEGVPTQAGDSTFVLRVTDRRNSYAEISSTISITAGEYTAPTMADDMAITGDFTTNVRVNENYSGGVSLSNYDDSTVWSVVSGTLPPGLSLSGSRDYCYIRGILNAGGSYNFTLRAVNSKNKYAERNFLIKVNDTPYEAEDMSIEGDFTTDRRVNENYSSTVSVNGAANYWPSLTMVSGALPPGLSLSRSTYNYIDLYGIPNTGGAYTFTLRATDSRNAYIERTFTVKINDTPFETADMSIEGDFTTDRRVNESYSSSVSVHGLASYWPSLTMVSGALPPGLSLQVRYGNDIYLEGIPNKGGTYTFTLRVTDIRNAYIDRTFTVKINDTPYAASDMSIEGDFDTGKNVNESYSSTVAVNGAGGNHSLTVVKGTLPPGLSLRWYYGWNLYGIPNTPGAYTFTLRATDSRNAYIEREFTVTINGDSPSDPTTTTDMSLSGIFAEGYTVNTWYSSYVQLSGGTADYTFKVTGGSLPPGFYIRQAGSQFYLEGIPNTAGTYTFKLRVIDQRNTYTEREFTVKINGEHYATTDMSLGGSFAKGYTVNNWYSNNVQVSGGTADYTFNITSGAFPPGFFIRQDGSSFYLEGIPNKTGTYTFGLKVTDRRNAYTERTFSMTIEGTEIGGDDPDPAPSNPIKITTSSLPNVKEGENYSATITTTGDVGNGLTWVITGLPEGLSYTTSGNTCTISGTPSTAGTFTVSVNVANTETEDAKSFTLTVEPKIVEDPITITTSSLTYGVTGQTYSETLTATGTVTSWKVTGGALPSGLTLSETAGTISGTVAESAIEHNADEEKVYSFEVTASNTSGGSAVKSFSISVSEPVKFATDSTLPNGKVDEAYEATITVNGTIIHGMTWVITGLPEEFVYAGNGRTCTITGTPKTAGTYMLKANTANIRTEDFRDFTLVIEGKADPITITTASLPDGGTSKDYSQTLTATGNVTSWAVTSGDLPAGLKLDSSTGTISGTIADTAAGGEDSDALSYKFDITASNASTSAVKTFELLVYKSITVLTESLPNAIVGEEYSATIEASGGRVIAWVLKPAIDVPGWLKYSNNNNILDIWGVPTTAGTYTFTSDCGNVYCDCQKKFTLVVEPKPTPAVKPRISLPKTSGIILAGESYTFQPAVTGTAPITWAVKGNVPPGLTLDTSTGKLSGTITATDEGKYAHVHMPYNFTLTAANRGGTDSADVFIPVWYKPEIITSPDLTDAVKNKAYNATITAEGTEFSMEWKKTGGTLPKGLTLSMNKSSRTCSLTGSPTETGTFTFTLELSSIAGLVDMTRTFTLKVNDDSETNTGAPVINTISLPDGQTGTAYVAVLDATGAKPIKWSKSGSLPKGLKLDEYGTIIGIPTKAKTYRFTVKATNSAGTTSQKITITITGEKYSKPKIKTSKIPPAVQNEPYSAQLACKGTGPITWSFADTKYPAGLYITEDGRISGIPKEAGKFKVKVKAENNIGSSTKTYSLKVSGLVPEITNENLPSGIVGIQYTGQLVADGTDPIKWSKSGSLPSGLKLTAKTGVISGTPRKAGTYSFKITAKNKYGKETRDFVIIVGVVEADSESAPETREAVTENLADASPVNTPEIIEAYPEPEADISSAEIDLCVVSGDEELRGEIYAPEGQPLTFRIGEYFEDAEVFIADEAIAIEIADDGTFVLPGELVSNEFVIYVMAGNTKTIELYIIAEQEE